MPDRSTPLLEIRTRPTPKISVVRNTEGNAPHIAGYAIVWEARSVPIADWFETFREVIPS